jgi:hypothetical protein
VYYLVMNIGIVKDGALSFVGFSSCQFIVCCLSDGRVSLDDVHQTLGMFWFIQYAPVIDDTSTASAHAATCE